MYEVIDIKYSDREIKKRREEAAKLFIERSANIKNPDLKGINEQDLKLLFELYDENFFHHWFADNFAGTLGFTFSRRMTRSAGITSCPRNIDPARPESMAFQIKISIDFLSRYDTIKGNHLVSGIKTRSRLEALQLIFEHELVHVIEFIHFRRSNCKNERFKNIAHSLFGHTESYHHLPTNQQVARQKLGIIPGDRVSFRYEGKRLEGVLHRINKRATVMVPDRSGDFADTKGQRYSKYYVPLSIIKKI